MPFSVREGINIFLAGFIPTENLRFREEELNFKMATSTELFDNPGRTNMYHYPAMTKSMKTTGTDGGVSGARVFTLHVEPGSFTDSEIIVMLGENGTGKTTFIRMMAGLLKSDEAVAAEEEGDMDKAAAMGVPQLNVRYVCAHARTCFRFNSVCIAATSRRRSPRSSRARCANCCTRRSATRTSIRSSSAMS